MCNFMFEKPHCGTVQIQRVSIETNQYHVSSAEGVLVYLNLTTANTDHLKTLSLCLRHNVKSSEIGISTKTDDTIYEDATCSASIVIDWRVFAKQMSRE